MRLLALTAGALVSLTAMSAQVNVDFNTATGPVKPVNLNSAVEDFGIAA